jgi:hypothetical protein
VKYLLALIKDIITMAVLAFRDKKETVKVPEIKQRKGM